MSAVVYLIFVFLIGYFFLYSALPEGKCRRMYSFHAAFPAGAVILGWVTYISSYWFYVEKGRRSRALTMAPASCAVLVFFIAFLIGLKQKTESGGTKAARYRFSARETLFFACLFSFILFSFCYVFHIKNGRLYVGATVFSDYSPNLALVRSFSKSNNFPTQYPFYGGSDIKYHFMYQFFTGTLEYLGMRIDIAYNLTSALGLLSFCLLLYDLSVRIIKKKAAGIVTLLLFFFRSGSAIFIYLFEHTNTEGLGTALNGLKENRDFLGYTLHEEWGLWNYNVFLNQRHLGFILPIAVLILLSFYDIFEEGAKTAETWTSKEGWTPARPAGAVLLGALLGACAFWNGAVVISTLLMLFGFAVFANHKTDFLFAAVPAAALSVFQSKVFIKSGMTPVRFKPWFLSESAHEFLLYILFLSGFYAAGVVIMFFAYHGLKRKLLFSFCLPYIFAFTVSMTPDITVNHKYIIIATIFVNILWADIITKLSGKKILAGILIILLTGTGAYDMRTVFIRNKTNIAVDVNADITKWLEKNTTEKDLVLTPRYALNEVSISGCMLYNPHTYYAWSAGYDTDKRTKIQDAIYTSESTSEAAKLLKESKITIIIWEDGYKTDDGILYTEKAIKKLCKEVYNAGRYRVYRVPTAG